jgi:hypothetical protein
MTARAHRVILCRHAKPRRKREGGRVALFAFSWADLAVLFGLKVPTVQKLAKAGAFDPADLESIFRALSARCGTTWSPRSVA